MTNGSKKGFTLVELSIVLVIIGLLIGGILVAQSMITTAKIQSLARQIGQFDAGVANFKTKYGTLPGDSTLFGAAAGDGNGIVEGPDTAITQFTLEIGKFWYDLGQTGLKNENGTAYTDGSSGTTNPAVAGVSIPLAAAGTNAGVIGYGSGGTNFYLIGRINASTSGTAFALTDAFKPADALAFDAKLDDGIANSGLVWGADAATLSVSNTNGTGITAGTDCSTVAAGATYDVAITTDECSIRVRMGSVTGTPY